MTSNIKAGKSTYTNTTTPKKSDKTNTKTPTASIATPIFEEMRTLSPHPRKRAALQEPELENSIAKRTRSANPAIPQGQSPKTAKQLKMAHFTEQQLAASPKKKKVGTSHPFFSKSLKEKLTKEITTGRNTAIGVIKIDPDTVEKPRYRYIVCSTKGLPGETHAEIQVIDAVRALGWSKEDIVALYTDRAPCPRCKRKLALLIKNVPISYISEYPTDHTLRKGEALAFHILLAEKGVRAARNIIPQLPLALQKEQKEITKLRKQRSTNPPKQTE